jgi:hypothetical protein
MTMWRLVIHRQYRYFWLSILTIQYAPERNRVLADIGFVSSTWGNIYSRISDNKRLVIRRHIHDISVTNTVFCAQTR